MNSKMFLPLILLFAAFVSLEHRADAFPSQPHQEFSLEQELGDIHSDLSDDDPIAITAWFELEPNSSKGKLFVQVNLAENWHVYSMTLPKGGPMPSKVVVDDSIRLTADFEPDRDPRVIEKDPIFGTRVEDFKHTVTWVAPFESDMDAGDLVTHEPELQFSGQTCVEENGMTGSCIPVSESLVALFRPTAPPALEAWKASSHVNISGSVKTSGSLKPGDTIKLEIRAESIGDYHIYPYSAAAGDGTTNPTRIAITKSNGWAISEPKADKAPETKFDQLGVPSIFHHDPVVWSMDVEIPADAEEKTYTLSGSMGFQTCTEMTCDMPEAAKFTVEIPVGQTINGDSIPVTFSSGDDYNKVVEEAQATVFGVAGNGVAAKDAGEWSDKSLAFVLPLAFLAGLILNIMPCVLPVIGLKIMSFVQQAGENPLRVFMLNFVFALGMLVVFMLLATLAVFFGYGWGDLYQSLTFKVSMISIVFVFALSFFGVWEIPIPGFVGTGSGAKMAEKEGYTGAFLKGILTTLLATPCSGPLLVPAVVWAIAQPPVTTYTVFFALGLGMAAPYLLIGAFPKLANFLPRPGNWMITFKQIMGFVLMATVVFLMNSIGPKFNMSVLSLLVFLGLACWWIGRTSLAAELPQKLKAWTVAAAITGIGLLFSFYFLIPQHELDWQTYSKGTLQQSLDDGNLVFVDFTADW